MYSTRKFWLLQASKDALLCDAEEDKTCRAVDYQPVDYQLGYQPAGPGSIPTG
jgi:hypothetical protein